MVGKNNNHVKRERNAEKVNTYSIRKFKNGIASVAIGGLLVGAIAVNPEAAIAAEADAATNQVELAQATEATYIDPLTTDTRVITGRTEINVDTLNLTVNPTRGGNSFDYRAVINVEADGSFAFDLPTNVILEVGDVVKVLGRKVEWQGGNLLIRTIQADVTVTEAPLPQAYTAFTKQVRSLPHASAIRNMTTDELAKARTELEAARAAYEALSPAEQALEAVIRSESHLTIKEAALRSRSVSTLQYSGANSN